MDTRIGLNSAMAREFTMDKMSAEGKKNSRVPPCFLLLRILKGPFWAT
jgi:hypothetical protein